MRAAASAPGANEFAAGKSRSPPSRTVAAALRRFDNVSWRPPLVADAQSRGTPPTARPPSPRRRTLRISSGEFIRSAGGWSRRLNYWKVRKPLDVAKIASPTQRSPLHATRFMLGAAMNPCPYGFHGNLHSPCPARWTGAAELPAPAAFCFRHARHRGRRAVHLRCGGRPADGEADGPRPLRPQDHVRLRRAVQPRAHQYAIVDVQP
jgi:hypothetical protein